MKDFFRNLFSRAFQSRIHIEALAADESGGFSVRTKFLTLIGT